METTELDTLIFTQKFKIKAFELDFRGSLKLSSLCNYLQEVATNHAFEIGFGLEEMMSKNLTWVLTRLKVEFYNHPKFEDEITMETWSSGIQGMYGNREYSFYNSKKECIGVASSSWLIINMKTRRPVNPESVKHFPSLADKKVFDEDLKKISELENKKLIYSHKVKYSAIDINRHVNNVKYIEWIIDAYEKEHFLKKEIKSFEINYLKEILMDDNLDINMEYISEDNHRCSLTESGTQKDKCRAELIWRNKQ